MRVILLVSLLFIGGCQLTNDTPPTVTKETIQLICLHGVEYAVWRGGSGAGGMTLLVDRMGTPIQCDE